MESCVLKSLNEIWKTIGPRLGGKNLQLAYFGTYRYFHVLEYLQKLTTFDSDMQIQARLCKLFAKMLRWSLWNLKKSVSLCQIQVGKLEKRVFRNISVFRNSSNSISIFQETFENWASKEERGKNWVWCISVDIGIFVYLHKLTSLGEV